jgi:hypothetical protein
MRVADFVEEALEDDALLCRQQPERGVRGGVVVRELLRGGGVETDVFAQPDRAAFAALLDELPFRTRAQPRYRRRQLVAAASPNQNGMFGG